jgi:hypothetical protein
VFYVQQLAAAVDVRDSNRDAFGLFKLAEQEYN